MFKPFGLSKVNFKNVIFKPYLLLGSSILIRKDANNLIKNTAIFTQKLNKYIFSTWRGFGILSNCLGRISCAESVFFLD